MKITRKMNVTEVELTSRGGPYRAKVTAESAFDEQVTYTISLEAQPRVNEKVTVIVVQQPEDEP